MISHNFRLTRHFVFSSKKNLKSHLYRFNYKIHQNNVKNKKNLTNQNLLIISQLSSIIIINRDSMFRIWDFFTLMFQSHIISNIWFIITKKLFSERFTRSINVYMIMRYFSTRSSLKKIYSFVLKKLHWINILKRSTISNEEPLRTWR